MPNPDALARLTPFSVKRAVEHPNRWFWACFAASVGLFYCMLLRRVHYWLVKLCHLTLHNFCVFFLFFLLYACMYVFFVSTWTANKDVYINSYFHETFSDWFVKSGKWMSSQVSFQLSPEARLLLVLLAFWRSLLCLKIAYACCLRMMRAGSYMIF